MKQPGGFAALNLDANYISDEVGEILGTRTRPTLTGISSFFSQR
jgi:hypothetical protein